MTDLVPREAVIPAGPIRTCAGCRVRRSTRELLRVRRRPDGTVAEGIRVGTSGRGAYLCLSRTCFETAIRRKDLVYSLSRAGKKTTLGDPESLWAELIEEIARELGDQRYQGSQVSCARQFALVALQKKLHASGRVPAHRGEGA